MQQQFKVKNNNMILQDYNEVETDIQHEQNMSKNQCEIWTLINVYKVFEPCALSFPYIVTFIRKLSRCFCVVDTKAVLSTWRQRPTLHRSHGHGVFLFELP